MCGDREIVDPLPRDNRLRKYYWPWQCRYPREQFQFSLAALFAVLTVAAFCSCVCGVFIRSVDERGLSAAEANRRLWYIGIPPRIPDDATNVSVTGWHRRVSISYDVGLPTYRRCCDGRNLRRFISPPDPVPGIIREHYEKVPTTNGYYFDDMDHRGGVYSWYDLDRQRAWFEYSSN